MQRRARHQGPPDRAQRDLALARAAAGVRAQPDPRDRRGRSAGPAQPSVRPAVIRSSQAAHSPVRPAPAAPARVVQPPPAAPPRQVHATASATAHPVQAMASAVAHAVVRGVSALAASWRSRGWNGARGDAAAPQGTGGSQALGGRPTGRGTRRGGVAPEGGTGRWTGRGRHATWHGARSEEQRRLAQRRLVFLAVVLLASTVGVQLASHGSPARMFAVSSNSMEPEISRGDLVVASTGEPKMGDVVVYAAATGGYQTHRVVRIVQDGDETRYVTRGDANDGDDSFLVERADIVGVVERSVPVVGYAWLVPLAWKVVLFFALLASYLGVTAWDARAAPGKVASAAVLLILLVPGTFAGVAVTYPASDQTHGVLASPLPLAAGDEGTATVAADLNSATATGGAPLLWKEIPLNGGDDDISITSTSYSEPTYDRAVIDLAKYDPAPVFFLESYMQAPAGQSIAVRLYDRSTSTVVASSEATTSSGSFTLVRSAGFALAGANEYSFQAMVSAGTGTIRQVKVLASQEAPVGDTVTHVRMSGEDTTSSIIWSYVPSTAYWRYDGAATDGTVTAHVEIVAHQSHSGALLTDGVVYLYDRTAALQASSVAVTATSPTRYTFDVTADLVDGHEYAMIFKAPDATSGMLHLHHARLVVQQASFQKTVDYVDLGGLGTTTSDTYVAMEYAAVRHRGTEEAGAASYYFESTLKNSDSVSGTSYARLYDQDAGAAVAASEVSRGGVDRVRVRSVALELATEDTTYRVQAKGTSGTTATLYSAWIIAHVDLVLGDGLRHDHVLQTSVNTPANTCTWRFSLTDVSGASLTRMQRAHVDWRVGTAGTVQETPLPSGRQFASAVWTGTHVYVFGGTDGTRTDQIVRYDPATDTISTMSATLPSARAETSAVWDGTHAYVFGGNSNSGMLAEIVRYDPATDSVTTMAGTLTTARRHTSAAWDGTHAYIFGGITASGNTDQILRYDPSTDSVTTAATLPTVRYGTSAVWDGTHAYVFGGSDGGFHDDIVRFDPATGRTKLLAAALPTARYYTSAVWVGTYVYIFGGYDTDYMDRIDRFDPQTGRVTTMPQTLPTARYGTAAVWDGAAAHVIGGLETGFVDSDDVVAFHAPVQMLGLGDIVLPEGRSSAGAVWDGSHAYLFGGFGPGGARLGTIVQYDPALRRVDTMAATLPTDREATSAVWDGTHAYIFGGRADGGLLDEVLRYDPATDTLTTMTATLPTAREATAVVWDGTYAYIIGGEDASSKLDDVLRYDPATDSITTMTGALATPRKVHSAFWDGTHAYVAGGLGDSGALADIERYDPGSDAFTTMTATLPTGRHGMAVAWDGTYAYLYGGFDGARLDDILRYSPSGDAISTLAQSMPVGHNLASAVWDGSHAYVLGGLDTDLQRLATIVRHDPAGQVDDVAHLLRESGQGLLVRPGGVLQSIMETKPGAAGTTTLTTTLQGRCVGHGIHTEQAVTYRFD